MIIREDLRPFFQTYFWKPTDLKDVEGMTEYWVVKFPSIINKLLEKKEVLGHAHKGLGTDTIWYSDPEQDYTELIEEMKNEIDACTRSLFMVELGVGGKAHDKKGELGSTVMYLGEYAHWEEIYYKIGWKEAHMEAAQGIRGQGRGTFHENTIMKVDTFGRFTLYSDYTLQCVCEEKDIETVKEFLKLGAEEHLKALKGLIMLTIKRLNNE